ncbi:MAG: hypothetical protein ACJAWV_003510 [Flammeovirgaceae bacterium]|jgi:hypothetical protein
MKLELKKNIWKSDESGLGFYCLNIFECSEMNPNIKDLLINKILKEKEFGSIENINTESKEPTDYYGSIFLNKIQPSDFKVLNFKQFKSEIKEYWKDEDWGEDLPIFKNNFELAISVFNQIELSTRNFYYINAEEIDSEKLVHPHFFTYFVCIISTQKESNKIFILTFGID